MIEVKAPRGPQPHEIKGRDTIFLSGSIEMGTAEHWQARVVRELTDFDVVIFNPRRDDWDSTWRQSREDSRFKEQVEWELRWLRASTMQFICFDPNTRSPITLLELGIIMQLPSVRPAICCCPEGFWRRGNVEIVCDWGCIDLYHNFAAAMDALRVALTRARDEG